MILSITAPDDMHVHLRKGEILKTALRYSAEQFARALIMPNTVPPVVLPKELLAYKQEIDDFFYPNFKGLMTFQVMPPLNKDTVCELKQCGALAGKLYPRGSTTNAESAPSEIGLLSEVFSAMEENGLILSIHAEDPKYPVFEREFAFLEQVERIRTKFPKLKIVVEHVSDYRTIEYVNSAGPNVASSVTLHHLLFTIDDIIGGKLEPHLFCKPTFKQKKDRDAIRNEVFSGNPKFFFGSDSAPHPKKKKETEGAAGIFSAPVLLPKLVELFEENGCLNKLEAFVSFFGADFYKLPRNKNTVVLEKKAWEVPLLIDGLVPLFAGKNLNWKLSGKK